MKAHDRLRSSARLFSAIEVRDPARPKAGPWLTRNISTGGLFLLAPKLWRRGELVRLQLADARASLEVPAIVTHVAADGTGFQFATLPQAVHERLSDLICARIVSGASFAERRRELRRKTKLAARLRDGSEEHAVLVLDLNRGGARLASSLEVEPAASLYFLLQLLGSSDDVIPSPTILGTEAKVVYVAEDGFAIQFVAPSDEFQRAVVGLLASA